MGHFMNLICLTHEILIRADNVSPVVVTDLLKGKYVAGSYSNISAFCEAFMVTVFFFFYKENVLWLFFKQLRIPDLCLFFV